MLPLLGQEAKGVRGQIPSFRARGRNLALGEKLPSGFVISKANRGITPRATNPRKRKGPLKRELLYCEGSSLYQNGAKGNPLPAWGWARYLRQNQEVESFRAGQNERHKFRLTQFRMAGNSLSHGNFKTTFFRKDMG